MSCDLASGTCRSARRYQRFFTAARQKPGGGCLVRDLRDGAIQDHRRRYHGAHVNGGVNILMAGVDQIAGGVESANRRPEAGINLQAEVVPLKNG